MHFAFVSQIVYGVWNFNLKNAAVVRVDAMGHGDASPQKNTTFKRTTISSKKNSELNRPIKMLELD